jgi:hypothetical protein
MQRLREINLTSALLAAVAIAAASAVMAGDLKSAAPKKVDLTAIWKINPELSDDPQKVLAKKRDESSGRGPMGGGGGGGGGGGSTAHTRVGKADVDVGGGILGDVIAGTIGSGSRGGGGSGDRPAADPEPTGMRVPLDSFLATREQFEIQQRPDALTISTLDETSTCKPGTTEKVPLQSGETVERHCGWDGGAFVIELASDDGVKRINRYELHNGDRQLVLVSEIKGGHGQLRGLQLKRVYDRTVAF